MQRDPQEIYLDCNATTHVIPEARRAVQQVMEDQFGNPSSSHLAGIRAKSVLEETRAAAARYLGVRPDSLIFTSGATEGIQLAVFSALIEGVSRIRSGDASRTVLLYGATEHKAVPEALRHWNQVLGNLFEVRAVRVDSDGRIDTSDLSNQLSTALLVCTMAANNETGVFQDLQALERIIRSHGNSVLWLVDSVQALGKLPIHYSQVSIDYAPFSGHKLYAPKGTGLLYVRPGTPITPMNVGGGQEKGLRSGTENLPGVAAMGAVFRLLEQQKESSQRVGSFCSEAELFEYRSLLKNALLSAFPSAKFASRDEVSIPTTLNFAVPGLTSRDLLDVFDAAGVRVSAGSACNSNIGKAPRSHVLDAMGLDPWRSEGAVRLSWGLATSQEEIQRAIQAIHRASRALSSSCIRVSSDAFQETSRAFDGVLQLRAGGANTWILVGAKASQCVIIDPLPELTDRLIQFVTCQKLEVLGVLDTHSHADHESSRSFLIQELSRVGFEVPSTPNLLGWPENHSALTSIEIRGRTYPALRFETSNEGALRWLVQVPTPGHTSDSQSYLWMSRGSTYPTFDLLEVDALFCGDLILAGGLGRTDFLSSDSEAMISSLQLLDHLLSDRTVVCPAHDYENTFATSWGAEKSSPQSLLRPALIALDRDSQARFVNEKKRVDQNLSAGVCVNPKDSGAQVLCGVVSAVSASLQVNQIASGGLPAFLRKTPSVRVIDVREPHEHELMQNWDSFLGGSHSVLNVPLSRFVNFSSEILKELQEQGELPPMVFLCRSGNRSLQAVRSLQRLGVSSAWTLEGGFALNT